MPNRTRQLFDWCTLILKEFGTHISFDDLEKLSKAKVPLFAIIEYCDADLAILEKTPAQSQSMEDSQRENMVKSLRSAAFFLALVDAPRAKANMNNLTTKQQDAFVEMSGFCHAVEFIVRHYTPRNLDALEAN